MFQKIDDIPHTSGVYLMRDRTGLIIYIGKALDLKKRVSSYFHNKTLPSRIASLISNVIRVDYLITQDEHAALILENRLIKKYQPRYNVLMRDDKTYPYLVLMLKEKFPRLILSRKKKKDGNLYFGPYPFVAQVRSLLAWLIKNFNLRPCKETFSEKLTSAKRKKYESCLYMHIGKCPAPCLGKITQAEYASRVRKIKLFMLGKHNDLLELWRKEMKQASAALDYERASQIRDRIFALEKLYERVRFKQIDTIDTETGIEKTQGLRELKNILKLKLVPLIIESFDISNIGGNYAVGSMVRFKNGEPDKSNYRKFKIKTVTGSNDVAMIREVIDRRYSRLVRENKSLPDLVLIDGGRAQLEAACAGFKALELRTDNCISLAKQNEEIYTTQGTAPIVLKKDNAGLKMIMKIRDETHRFAIAYYRKRHRKEMLAQAPTLGLRNNNGRGILIL